MTISVLQNEFKVSTIDSVVDIPTRINIKKRKERVVYKTLSNQDKINISYVLGQEITPANNLSISDRSVSLTQNRIPSFNNLQIDETSILNLNVDKFLVTNVFTNDIPTKAPIPLFFFHKLKNYDPEIGSGQSILSLEFADSNLRQIQLGDFIFNSSTGELFNNIENNYNSITGQLDLKFIKYTIRTTQGSTQTINIYHELIDNQPIFSQASFDDIDQFGNLNPNSRKYILEEQAGGQSFQITLPNSDIYAYKEIADSRIKVLPPTVRDINNRWNIRITNGKFISSLQRNLGQFFNFKYEIAEFNNQLFFPFPPYKFQPEESAIFLKKNLIKVAKNIVIDFGLNLFIDIIIKTESGETKIVYSNNPDKIDSLFNDGILKYKDGILSVDRLNGFIEVEGPLTDNDNILVTYYTEENEFEFTSIDFNPVNNLDILNQRIVLYISPESSFTGNLEKNLYYLVVNSLGEIIFSSQAAEGEGSIDPSTIKLTSEDFDIEGKPTHQFFYDIPSTSSGLQSRISSGILLEHIDEFSFIDKYTVESVLLNSSIFPSGNAISNYEENSRFLVLADIYVGENQSPDSLDRFDVRIQGGGIKDSKKEESLKLQPEVSWFWDFNGNRPYPGMEAFYGQVPLNILKENGGRFTRKEIADIFNRHMKLGSYSVIDKYGINPTIIETSTTSGSFVICWPSYGDQISYNVYYSTDMNKNFIKVNSNILNDIPSGNCINVSGLSALTKYFTKVEAIDTDKISSFGPTISITTASAII